MTPEHIQKKYKSGEVREDGLVFWGYDKRIPGGEKWVTNVKYRMWRGYDAVYTVYYLPNENYYGSTTRLRKRLDEHKLNGKDISGWLVIASFDNKQDAFDCEEKLQIENGGFGYPFTKKWRVANSRRTKKALGQVWKNKRIKVVCNETGEVYNSIKEAEIKNNISKGRVSVYLQGKSGPVKGKTFSRI